MFAGSWGSKGLGFADFKDLASGFHAFRWRFWGSAGVWLFFLGVSAIWLRLCYSTQVELSDLGDAHCSARVLIYQSSVMGRRCLLLAVVCAMF